MVMQGEHTGVYPGSGKRRPYVQRGEEVCISLHRSVCVGVTSMRERAPSPSLKERKKGQGWLLEVSISRFSLLSVVVRSGASFLLLPLQSPALPFYRARGGQDDGEP
jgi:hypothetical protein